MTFSRSSLRLLALAAAIASCNLPVALADAFDAPDGYYSTATGTRGLTGTLKSQLYTISGTGFTQKSYAFAVDALMVTDADPANSSRIILIYNRASIINDWDPNDTVNGWNREHIWPQSHLGGTTSGPGSDLHNLRPANPRINSDRGNSPFGKIGVTPPTTFGDVSDSTGTYWFPGSPDRGDVARSVFYMATRYGQNRGSANMSLVNGQPVTNSYQMGDLASLLRWHYQDPVDTFERNRNHLIATNAMQGNRNPYIDRPEFVWSVFGTGANTSQLSVVAATGDAVSTDGSSTATVNLGRVISGSAFATRSVTLNKSGTTPTTFDATVTGSATSTLSGPRNTFDYDAGTRSFTVGIAGSTATTGARTGTIRFDNTDVTSGAATGQGAADGDDVVNVTGAVVSHAQPSFSRDSIVSTLNLNFGIVAQDSTALTAPIAVANAGVVNAFVAGLDVDSIARSGDTAAFAEDLATSTNLAVGLARSFAVSSLTTALGQHAATYTLLTSDENIPGATSLGSLSLAVSSRVAIGGDATLDDQVNFQDLVVLAQNYNGEGTTWTAGDFDRSGTTNFQDLVTLAQHYNTGATAIASLGVSADFAADWALAQSLVPEPTTFAAVGLIAVTAFRRRR